MSGFSRSVQLCHRDAYILPQPHPRPHLCVQADTGSRRRWLESGRLQCLWGGSAGADTHSQPPHSAAPQSPEGRHSGSLRVLGCRSHGCDRAGIDKRRVSLNSSVHCSLGHTAGKKSDGEPGREPIPALQGTQLKAAAQI